MGALRFMYTRIVQNRLSLVLMLTYVASNTSHGIHYGGKRAALVLVIGQQVASTGAAEVVVHTQHPTRAFQLPAQRRSKMRTTRSIDLRKTVRSSGRK